MMVRLHRFVQKLGFTFSLVALGSVLSFQNCGKGFSRFNGEPYEGIVAQPNGSIIDGSQTSGSGGGQSPPQGLPPSNSIGEFQTKWICSPLVAGGVVTRVRMGKYLRSPNGEDAVVIDVLEGQRTFVHSAAWLNQANALALNVSITPKIFFQSIEFWGLQTQSPSVTVYFMPIDGGIVVAENLECR